MGSMTRTVWRVTATPLDAPFIESPRDARYHYSKRFGKSEAAPLV